ncbi:MAG: hypothetical protein ACEPOW_13390 [Bacteroidales bacterium]
MTQKLAQENIFPVYSISDIKSDIEKHKPKKVLLIAPWSLEGFPGYSWIRERYDIVDSIVEPYIYPRVVLVRKNIEKEL